MNKAKVLFFIISGSYLACDLFGYVNFTFVLKPLIISSLLFYYLKEAKNKPSKVIITALIFSISGDFWLMFSGEMFFLLGLGSFLLTQVLYTISFYRIGAFQKIEPIHAIAYLSIFLLILSYLWRDLGSFTIPVCIYAFAILLMGYASSTLKDRKNDKPNITLIIGTGLFILSDSLIALNKFKGNDLEIPMVHFMIMVTYILGQYYIIQGFIRIQKFQMT